MSEEVEVEEATGNSSKLIRSFIENLEKEKMYLIETETVPMQTTGLFDRKFLSILLDIGDAKLSK